MVELNGLDGSRVFRCSGHERVGRAGAKLLGVPEVEGTIFKSTSDDTTGAIGGRLAPCNVVEPTEVSEL